MKVVVSRTSKKIISLRVDDNGVLQVLANKRLTITKIRAFVESKRDWILQQLSLQGTGCAACAPRPVEAECVADGNYGTQQDFDIASMFSGKACLLRGDVFSVRSTVESKCYLDGCCIYIPEKFYASKENRLKALKSYVKKLSAQNVSDEISKFGSYASLCPTKIEFRNIPNSWIKCTTPYERVISLDYRVFQLPEKLQKYLIVHAFSHFTNEGHDEVFWNTVSNYLPRYRSCMEELKQYDFLKDI